MTALAEQIIVVTGAGTGIGKAAALALGRHGGTLALVGRRPMLLEAVVDIAREGGVQARAYPADLASEEEISDLAGTLKRDFGRVDILVHCAAIVRPGAVADASADDFDRHYQTNLRGPYLLTQALLPLIRARQGQIVFVNSSVGLQARGQVGQYAATKHALKAIADTLREEGNRDGVRVLSVYPGRTATPSQEVLHALEGRSYRPDRLLQPEDIATMVVSALCLPRTAEVTDIQIRPMLKPD